MGLWMKCAEKNKFVKLGIFIIKYVAFFMKMQYNKNDIHIV